MMTLMLSRFALPALAAFLIFAARGQQPGATFRTTARLVEVNVTALDSNGRPVTGLDRKDFEVLDNGKRRDIAFFRFDANPAPEAPAPAPGTYSNRNEPAADHPWNISALVIDSLNTPATSNIRVRAQLMRYLQALAPETRVAIYSMGAKLQVLHDFTSDAESLRERVRKASIGMPLESIVPIDELAAEAERLLATMDNTEEAAAMLERRIEMEMLANAAAQRSRLEHSLAAMEALGKHLAQTPGRKNLIWITAGFSMLSITGNMGFGPRGTIESYEDEVRKCAQRLAQNGVALYIVDAGELQVPKILDASSRPAPSTLAGTRGRFEPQVQTAELSADPYAAMNAMADITGGRYLHDTNDLMRGFVAAAADMRGSYTLGFYAAEPDERWHSLKVKTARRGVSLRHRQGYISEAGAPRATDPDSTAWREAAIRGIGSSSIALTARCEPAGSEIEVDLRIDPRNLDFRKDAGVMIADLAFLYADRTPDGATRETAFTAGVKIPESEFERAAVEGIHYVRRWTPQQDAVQTRIVVRDRRTGTFGTIDLPVRRILADAAKPPV
jgi:VWFA-related protein